METKNEKNWKRQYKRLKAYIAEHHHLPAKSNKKAGDLLNWAKYTRRKISRGTLSEDRKKLFLELMATRSTEHTGGRLKKPLE